jgi:hypothetical protein
MTIEAPPVRLTALLDRLTSEHAGVATPQEIAACVRGAWEAVRLFGAADDAEMVDVAARIAERELRLRLGLDREVARLDPEDHHR